MGDSLSYLDNLLTELNIMNRTNTVDTIQSLFWVLCTCNYRRKCIVCLYCIVLREMLVGRRGFFCLTKHCHCIILTTASSEYRLEKNIVEKGSSFKRSTAFNAIFTDRVQ